MNETIFANVTTTQRRRFGTNIPMDISSIMDVVMTQHSRYYINLLMNVFAIMNVSNPQHRVYDDDYSMNVFNIINTLMVQLGTSCSFDSPGLARNEPTPGKHSHWDSTP